MAYTKTQAGVEEIKTRALKLPALLRNLLLMVDGNKTATELENIAFALGAPAGALAELLQRGLVLDGVLKAEQADITVVLNPAKSSELQAERYTRLQQTMNDIVRNTMGLRGVFMTMKIEKCMGLGDLKALFPAFEAAVIKGAGEQVGRTLCNSIRNEL